MTATVEDIIKELSDETRSALVDTMQLFDHMCQPHDVGLSLEDFAAATTPDTIERDTPKRVASDMSGSELAREMEARGLKASGFASADAKKLQVEFDRERQRIIEEKQARALENVHQEEMELAVERNRTIMARLLSGELSAWEAPELRDARVVCRLMVANQTLPKVASAASLC